MGLPWSFPLLQNYNWLIFSPLSEGFFRQKLYSKNFMLQFSEIFSWDWKNLRRPWILSAAIFVGRQGLGSFVTGLKFLFCGHLHSKTCKTPEHGDFHAGWFLSFIGSYFKFSREIPLFLKRKILSPSSSLSVQEDWYNRFSKKIILKKEQTLITGNGKLWTYGQWH